METGYWGGQGSPRAVAPRGRKEVPLCPHTHFRSTDLGSNPGLRGERPAVNCLNHVTALNKGINLNYI